MKFGRLKVVSRAPNSKSGRTMWTCICDCGNTKVVYGFNEFINVEEIEQVSQRYSRENSQYEIVYYIKSGHTVIETFNDGIKCCERFEDISRILNDFNC